MARFLKGISGRVIKLIKPGYNGARSSMSLVNDVFAFAGHMSALGVASFAFIGTTSSSRGSNSFIDVASMPFPLRFVILLVIGSAMGWALGALVSWLSADQSDSRKIIAYIVAAITAGLLLFSADWLSLDAGKTAFAEFEALSFLGMAMALWVATFQFRMHSSTAGRAVLRVRSEALLIFAMTSLFVLALTIAGRV